MTKDVDPGPSLAEILVQSSVDGLAVIDRGYRYLLWNPAMERFTGKRADEVLGRNAFEVFPHLRDRGLDRAVDRALSGETVFADAVPRVEPDGTRTYYDRHYMPLRRGGAVVGMMAIVRDATARHNAQEALRSSEEKRRAAAEAAGVGFWSWDTSTDVVHWDDTMSAIFGLPPGCPPAGRGGYLELVHPDDRARAAEKIAQGVGAGGWEDEYRIVRPDGTLRWVLGKGTVVVVDGHRVAVGAILDVTERRQRDEQQRQAQKLEAVGQLTAGLAHNFNNILTALLPTLELAARKAPPELSPLLESAEHSALRAADLVRQLMTYAGRNRKATRRVESIGTLAERTAAFCRTTFDQRVAFEVDCDRGACARVDAAQIEQALLNLLINARDAVESAEIARPWVAVKVDVVGAGAPELQGRAGDHVRVRVGDNGVGMDAATVQRIYEPFFTTKEVGKGTGLGLTTTHAIVREHGGFLACRSAPQEGTTFSLFLPCEAIDTEPARADDCRGLDSPIPPSGETVLVVDDEEPIRRIVSLMLCTAGFDAKVASSGEEALELLRDEDTAAKVAVVLLDVCMPGTPGPKVRERLREIVPRARVVYFTGQAFDAPDGETVLEKPLTEKRLVGAVREALERRADR
jgi:PAS domain S-box-containing protein